MTHTRSASVVRNAERRFPKRPKRRERRPRIDGSTLTLLSAHLSCDSRAMEDDPEYAQQQWARNQKEMQQADEVSMRLYSELDLLEHPDRSRLRAGRRSTWRWSRTR